MLSKELARGVEAKLLQYEEYARVRCEDQIDIKSGLDELLNKKLDNLTCIMVNLPHHGERYANTIKELEKVSCTNLVHLKATFWKDREPFEKDLNMIMKFLSQYHPEIDVTKEYKIDDFSETHDKNIQIQDGPLACYCSHLRAMMYGYEHFDDYTIIVEDDISITDTNRINSYLKQIPDDWDIICLGCVAKFRHFNYEDTFYKFDTDFHSTHFYIIRNRCFPTLFKGMYPIPDQVDVLISNLKNELNIYNIPYCVYQKNIGTHTQNNLNVIFNSPNYDILRLALASIKKQCLYFCNLLLPNNEKQNEVIAQHLLYDIVFEYILKSGMDGTDGMHKEVYDVDYSEYSGIPEYKELFDSLFFFIRCCKKGIDPHHIAQSLLNNLFFTIKKFTLHSDTLKAYGFGSSSHVYVGTNGVLVKQYNDKLRWMTDGYDNPDQIFNNEVAALKMLQLSHHVPVLLEAKDNLIRMSYEGESLYDNFNLPENWKDQINETFMHFDTYGVNYPEFRLQNILVNDGNIVFVDFGMAEINYQSNEENCERFIRLLNILNERFRTVDDLDKRHELINTFYRNITLNGQS